MKKSRIFSLLLLTTLSMSVFAQRQPEEKLSMTFYALRNMYVDSVHISPLVEQQMMILMQCLDPHSEYLTPEQARANEDVLLGPTAQGAIGNAMQTDVTAKMIDKGIGYIGIGVFVQSTLDDFRMKVDSLRKKGMKSMVVDIRNNPGGFFDAALAVADEFLPVGSLMVVTEGKHQPRQEVNALVDGIWEKGNVVVLIDDQTMSAAEIFAGALQDWDRAVLMGSRTFGKGLIQETLPFSDGSAIRLSVARYTTPCGRSIQKPYAGRSREDYWNEVSRRSPDGVLPAEAMTKSFETLKNHRTVYAGGGIAPDVFVPSGDDVLAQAVALLKDSKRYRRLLTTSPSSSSAQLNEAQTHQPAAKTIVGILPDNSYDGRTIVLEHHHPVYYNAVTVLDSARIDNGRFVLNAAIPDSLLLTMGTLRLTEPKGTDLPSTFDIQLILTGLPTTVTVDSMGVSLSGNDLCQQFSDRVLQAERQRRIRQFALNDHYNALQAQRPLTEQEEALRQTVQETVSSAFMDVYGGYLRDYINLPFASELALNYPFDRYSPADKEFLLAHCNPQLLAQYEEREKSRAKKQQYFQESVKATKVGNHYREIQAFTPDGTPVSLTSLVQPGRVTLLDFWASWCMPCRQEIPFLKELYQKYHEQGFDIISISLDKSRDAWLKALGAEDMPWPQISDLKAWDGPVTQDYGIQAIPFVFLLDRQGNIALKNLHGDKLESAISQLLER